MGFLTVSLYLSVLPSLENGTQSHPGMNKAMKTNREVCVCRGEHLFMVHKWWSEDKFVGVNHSLSWGMQAPEPGPFAFLSLRFEE